jgi:hypothetical protein
VAEDIIIRHGVVAVVVEQVELELVLVETMVDQVDQDY